MSTKDLPSPEFLRKVLRYEPHTGKLFWRHRDPSMFPYKGAWQSWKTKFLGKEAFTSLTMNGYKQSHFAGRRLLAHRVIWAIANGCWPENDIDHINGVRHDNRLENLRSVTRKENLKNCKLFSHNTSGAMGVVWDKSRQKWAARIKVNQKNIHLGRFNCKSAAIVARSAAEKRYSFHKNHGRLT